MMELEKIQISTKKDARGSLSIVEGLKDIPFEIKRIYYIHSLLETDSLTRGQHAHKELYQVFIALHGNFEIVIDDGKQTKSYLLNDPTIGYYLKPGFWRELKNFSSDAVCLVLASDFYHESDYIRDYKEFLDWRKSHS